MAFRWDHHACLIFSAFAAAWLAHASPLARADSAPSVTCTPLRVDPPKARVATGAALQLVATGGSGNAVFSLEGETRGGSLEPSGGLRAGASAGRITAVARDGLCRSEARVEVEIVGPLDVEPARAVIGRGTSLHFETSGAVGEVEFVLLTGPPGARGAKVTRDGLFTAGDADGVYRLAATDHGSGREASLEVDVGRREALHARTPMLAVASAGRVRLDFAGGSGAVDAESSQGRVVHEGGALFFEAKGAATGTVEVRATDRFTREHASVRVLVGQTFGAPPIARGTQTLTGDLASGDLNGDGRPDLVVGHAERSKAGLEAGGVLVYYGGPAGFGSEPDLVLEGQNAGDRYGSVLVVADVNGDGIADLLVGSPDEALGESGRGAIALHLGSRHGLSPVPERVLAGEDAGHRFGSAVAVADLTGDGAPELVVTAPGAKNPFAKECEGGRAYVYRNRVGARGIFEAVPWQIIELRDPLSDDPEAALPCSATPLGAGRALALLDIDGDRALDLVVGAPLASYPVPGKTQGAVLVYRGGSDGRFEPAPAWSIHLDPAVRVDNAAFGAGLDVVADTAKSPVALVVRSPGFSPRALNGSLLPTAGAFWVFPQGALGPPSHSTTGTPRVRVVTTRAALSHYEGEANGRGVGRSAVAGDVDGDGRADYLVGSASPSIPGVVQVFSVAELLSARHPRPRVELASPGKAMQGFRVALLVGAGGSGLASWAATRSTAVGPFVGAIDYVPPSRAPLAAAWEHRQSLMLPNFGASDRAGASVALLQATADPHAPASSALAIVVGAPGAHSLADPTATPPRAAGEHIRAGTVDLFLDAASAPFARLSGDRNDAQIGAGPLAVLDFDGDGNPDLAVGDSSQSAGGLPPDGFVDPDGCVALDAKGNPTNVSGRGIVRIYSLVNEELVERFRLTAPRESARADAPAYLRNRFGFSIAAADVNGDKKDDLVVGRPGGRDSSGAEVVLGRKSDPKGRVLIACNKGEAGPEGALVIDSARSGDVAVQGIAVAGLGDLDKDGCDEVAISISRANIPNNPPRAGVIVAFGYDASGARCRGHRVPFLVRVVADDHPLDGNIPGDAATRRDDLLDLRGAPTGLGAVLARGHGDVTGDGIPDLVFRDNDRADGARRGPAVEILSGAYLAGLCPSRICREGRSGSFWSDGDWHVLALRGVLLPYRRVIESPPIAPRFGAAIALGDLTGDGIAELAVGSPDDSDEGPFMGEVRVYRGSADTLGAAAPAGQPDPWIVAVEGEGERGAFGSALGIARTPRGGFLVVGAPASSRRHLGGGVGAAYVFRVDGAK